MNVKNGKNVNESKLRDAFRTLRGITCVIKYTFSSAFIAKTSFQDHVDHLKNKLILVKTLDFSKNWLL